MYYVEIVKYCNNIVIAITRRLLNIAFVVLSKRTSLALLQIQKQSIVRSLVVEGGIEGGYVLQTLTPSPPLFPFCFLDLSPPSLL